MKIFLTLGIFLIMSPWLKAAPAPMHVESLKGCFHVIYRYVEDGKHDLDLKDLNGYPIVEWISHRTKEGDPTTHVLQHWGVYFDTEEKKYLAQKHWLEQWYPTSTGEWKQVVISPFGSIRYECQGKFHFNQLRCLATNVPKPQRDMNRTDYDVLDRENTLQFTSTGWVQAENNVKKKKDGTEVSIEVGWIEYRKVDEKECEAGKKAEMEEVEKAFR